MYKSYFRNEITTCKSHLTRCIIIHILHFVYVTTSDEKEKLVVQIAGHCTKSLSSIVCQSGPSDLHKLKLVQQAVHWIWFLLL